MTSLLHHLTLFTADLERTLSLFIEHLGFKELWRAGPLGGRGMASLFGLEEMEAVLVMLGGEKGLLLEVVHLIKPRQEPAAWPPAPPGPSGLCLEVDDLDGLHQRLSLAGWQPLSPVASMPAPTGESIRLFCIRTPENLLLEFIEAAPQA